MHIFADCALGPNRSMTLYTMHARVYLIGTCIFDMVGAVSIRLSLDIVL
jgi:hypothetical protein